MSIGEIVAQAQEIPGWMGSEELAWLVEAALGKRHVVEVGSWLGRSAWALSADPTTGLVCVDTWEGSAEHAEMLKDKPRDWLYQEFRQNLKERINIWTLRKPSVEAAKQFADGSLEVVFLDASHRLEDVRADITAWLPKLMSGGLLCGHDYQPSWPGVVRAVDELLPGARKIDGKANSIWYWRKP